MPAKIRWMNVRKISRAHRRTKQRAHIKMMSIRWNVSREWTKWESEFSLINVLLWIWMTFIFGFFHFQTKSILWCDINSGKYGNSSAQNGACIMQSVFLRYVFGFGIRGIASRQNHRSRCGLPCATVAYWIRIHFLRWCHRRKCSGRAASTNSLVIHFVFGVFPFLGRLLLRKENVNKQIDWNWYEFQTLLTAANLLQLTDVRDACCDYLQTQLDPSNCLGIRDFADIHGCVDLVNYANTYIDQHFS